MHSGGEKKRKGYPHLQVLVFWKCLVDNKDIHANSCARSPPKSIGNLQESIMKHPQPLPICWGVRGAGGWGRWGHMGRGSECFTMDICRFLAEFDGFLAHGLALISDSLLSTEHVQKTNPSEPCSFILCS